MRVVVRGCRFMLGGGTATVLYVALPASAPCSARCIHEGWVGCVGADAVSGDAPIGHEATGKHPSWKAPLPPCGLMREGTWASQHDAMLEDGYGERNPVPHSQTPCVWYRHGQHPRPSTLPHLNTHPATLALTTTLNPTRTPPGHKQPLSTYVDAGVHTHR